MPTLLPRNPSLEHLSASALLDDVPHPVEPFPYSKRLHRSPSFCATTLPLSHKDPYEAISTYIQSNAFDDKIFLILGCRGVGKTCLLNYMSKKHPNLHIMNLNNESPDMIRTKELLKAIQSYLHKVVLDGRDGQRRVDYLFRVQRHALRTFPDAAFALQQLDDQDGGAEGGHPIDFAAVRDVLEPTLDRLMRSTADQIVKYLVSFIDKAKELGHFRNEESYTFVIDNVDRINQPEFETTVFGDILTLAEKLVSTRRIRVIYAMRRATYERNPSDAFANLSNRGAISINVPPPLPLSLIISIVLRTEHWAHKHSDLVAGLRTTSHITVTGKAAIYLLVWLYLLIFRRDRWSKDFQILIRASNENTRAMIRSILTVAGFDYRNQRNHPPELGTLLDLVPRLVPELTRHQELMETAVKKSRPLTGAEIDSIFGQVKRTIDGALRRWDADHQGRHPCLTDYHMFGLLMYQGYDEYNPNLEGSRLDIQRAVSAKKLRDISPPVPDHERLFGVPFVNVFDNRTPASADNFVIRFILLTLVSRHTMEIPDAPQSHQRLSYNETIEYGTRLGLPRAGVADVLMMYYHKSYLLSCEFSPPHRSPTSPLMLTTKGETLTEVVQWPRFLNIVMRAMEFSDETRLRPRFDSDPTRLVDFLRRWLGEERTWYNQLTPDQQTLYQALCSTPERQVALTPTILSRAYLHEMSDHVSRIVGSLEGDHLEAGEGKEVTTAFGDLISDIYGVEHADVPTDE